MHDFISIGVPQATPWLADNCLRPVPWILRAIGFRPVVLGRMEQLLWLSGQLCNQRVAHSPLVRPTVQAYAALILRHKARLSRLIVLKIYFEYLLAVCLAWGYLRIWWWWLDLPPARSINALSYIKHYKWRFKLIVSIWASDFLSMVGLILWSKFQLHE